MKRTLILALALTGLVACGKTHKGTYESAAAASDGTANTELLQAGAAALWDQRGDPEKLKQSLASYEQIVAADPTNKDALLHLVRGYYFLGDGHLTDEDAKKEAWTTAIDWGKKCMGLNEEFKALLEKGDETEVTAARALTVDDVPCTYWTASAFGKWGKLEGIATILKYKDTIKAWMDRVDALDPDYFYTASTRYFGAYWAALPSFSGQDLPKSQEFFLKAIEANPDHFGNRVLYADYWARKTNNRQVFEEQLNYVLNGDVNSIPEIVPEQEAEVRKAQELMAQVDDLFVE